MTARTSRRRRQGKQHAREIPVWTSQLHKELLIFLGADRGERPAPLLFPSFSGAQGAAGIIFGGIPMAFFNSAVTTLQTLVVALGAGLGIWGVINLMEGYGNDNRATRS